MITKVACFSLVIVGMLLCHGSEDNEPADMRILFIGNSFTAFGDMPGMVEAILEQGPAGIRVKVERSFSGGKTLKWHWEDGTAPEKIRNGKFDVIVVQASSRSAYPNSLNEKDGYKLKDMEEYCGKFVRLARSHGAQPVLHCTQAASGKPEDRQRVVRQYTRLAKMFDVVMAPCGAAWQRAYQQRPNIVLDVGDAVHHQNRSGAYLSACVFSAVLSGKSPADSTVRGPAEATKKQPKLDGPTAEFLQSTAWETFQTYEQKGDVKVRTRSK